jgi:SAM-dependent methyltransferase
MSTVLLAVSRIKQSVGKTAWNVVRRKRLASYLKSDRRPWREGYEEYKDDYLRRVINDPSILEIFRETKELPTGYGLKLDARVIEIPWVIARLDERPGQFLDAGSALNHDYVLQRLISAKQRVTITTLAPEGDAYWRLGISYVFGDLRNLDFRDNRFDTIACISTIEHVGMDNTMYAGEAEIGRRSDPREFLLGVAELKRVLKPGGVLFVTVPFGRYENHGWFQQFDAEVMDQLIENFGPRRMQEVIFKYEADGWKLSNRAACADAEYFDVHTSKYFDASSSIEYPADYPAAERALACVELQK